MRRARISQRPKGSPPGPIFNLTPTYDVSLCLTCCYFCATRVTLFHLRLFRCQTRAPSEAHIRGKRQAAFNTRFFSPPPPPPKVNPNTDSTRHIPNPGSATYNQVQEQSEHQLERRTSTDRVPPKVSLHRCYKEFIPPIPSILQTARSTGKPTEALGLHASWDLYGTSSWTTACFIPGHGEPKISLGFATCFFFEHPLSF